MPSDPPSPSGSSSHNSDAGSENAGDDPTMAAISEIRTFVDQKFHKNDELLAILQNTLQTILDKFESRDTELAVFKSDADRQLQSFKNDVEIKFSALNVDMSSLKKRTAQLPLTGDFSKIFQEKAINESVVTNNMASDDSMDASFQNRKSVQAHFEMPEYIEKNKSRAPPGLAHSLATFKGPVGNDNWINVRETSFTAAENAILDHFDIIPDREEYLKKLKPGRPDATLSGPELMAYKNKAFQQEQKWNSDFLRDTRNWNGTNDFENWFDTFWRTATHNLIDNPKLLKDQLFDKMQEHAGISEILRPSNHRGASAFKYFLMIRRLVIPVADPEMAAGLFYSLKQSQNQTVDKFFKQKHKLFQAMYPGDISKRQWRDFYLNLAKSLLYPNLANDMAHFVDTMHYIEDYSAFLNHLLKRSQHYVNWANSGHTSTDNITACYSDALEAMFRDQNRENHAVIKKPIINEVQYVQPNVYNQRPNMSAHSDNKGWIADDDVELNWSHLETMVGALNNATPGKCWYCDKTGHVMNDCWSKQAGKPPHPDAKFGKMKKNISYGKSGNTKFANNKVLPDQFRKPATINQVDGEMGNGPPEPENKEDQEMKRIEEIMQEMMSEGQRKAPI